MPIGTSCGTRSLDTGHLMSGTVLKNRAECLPPAPAACGAPVTKPEPGALDASSAALG